MFDVFKAPIICNLKPSGRLATGFLLFCLVPLCSLLVLIPRFPVAVGILCALLLAACGHYVYRYALRNSARSVIKLRLYKHTALVTYKNREMALLTISGVCMASDWILLRLAGGREKIILDEPSIGINAYSSLSRQVRAYQRRETTVQ